MRNRSQIRVFKPHEGGGGEAGPCFDFRSGRGEGSPLDPPPPPRSPLSQLKTWILVIFFGDPPEKNFFAPSECIKKCVIIVPFLLYVDCLTD